MTMAEKQIVSVRLPRKLVRLLDHHIATHSTADKHLYRSTVIRAAVRRYLERKGKREA